MLGSYTSAATGLDTVTARPRVGGRSRGHAHTNASRRTRPRRPSAGSTRGSHRAERDERGRPAAHVHRHAAAGHRKRRGSCLPGPARELHAHERRRRRAVLERGDLRRRGCEHGRCRQCTIVFTSTTAGTVTGNASASVAGRLRAVRGRHQRCGARAPARRRRRSSTRTSRSRRRPRPTRSATNHTLTAHVNGNPGSGVHERARTARSSRSR